MDLVGVSISWNIQQQNNGCNILHDWKYDAFFKFFISTLKHRGCELEGVMLVCTERKTISENFGSCWALPK